MNKGLTRRHLLQAATITGLTAASTRAHQPGLIPALRPHPGWVTGRMSGAAAVAETLIAEGCECVYGIPGAQLNELWDAFKSKHLDYLLVTHEFSAACMADGYARSKGKPGVICVVPGPGLTNALTGIGEALLDSVPMVCVVGDVACGRNARPFQVHSLPNAAILQHVTKQVFAIRNAREIPDVLRRAFQLAMCGEPGPVGVVVPYNLLIEVNRYQSGPLPTPAVPWDPQAFQQSLHLMSQRHSQIGIYAGQGCMNNSPALVQLAEMLQAPVATSISGKGVIPENHPLAVGWGFGPQGTRTAEQVFRQVDLVLALGVKFSEVSTGVYSLPQPRRLIHVDANRQNLGRIMRSDVCVNTDAGLFMNQLLAHANCLQRPRNVRIVRHIQQRKSVEQRINRRVYARCGADPMALIMALRRSAVPDAMMFVDVTCSQYWATEVFTACGPRTFFNPSDNQAMGWSIPAALGAQRVFPGRQTLTLTGDGCMLMSAMEISTAARENLPVKFFILDDQAYNYMQRLQESAYMRTTATILARLDYQALARGWGVAYQEITGMHDLEGSIRAALCFPGPVLVRVVTDYRQRPIRWIQAARRHYTRELTPRQQARFAVRLGVRSLDLRPDND